MQNNNTITQTQNKVLFDLGQTFMTVGAREALEESNQSANEFLVEHSTGNWGEVCEEDAEEKMSFQSKKISVFCQLIRQVGEKGFG